MLFPLPRPVFQPRIRFTYPCQDHGHGSLGAPDRQPGLVHLHPRRQRRLRVGRQAGGHRLHVPPQRGGPHAAAQQGQEAGQAPHTDTGHIQVGHQFPEGLRPLAGGHTRRQGRGAAQTGLVRPALHRQPSQHDQVAGVGAVAPPGAGPAMGAGTRILGQGPLAFRVGRGWD